MHFIIGLLAVAQFSAAQLTTIGISTPGQTFPTTSRPITSSKSSTSVISTVPTTTTSTSSDDTGNDDIITKAFQPPPGCTNVATQWAGQTELWQNVVNPAASVTIGSCLPRQFVTSALSPTNLPPFKKLVCPMSWESYDWNSTYVICCPGDFMPYLPFINETDRPGVNAYCTSLVASGVIIDITSYSSNGATTETALTVSETEGAVIWAYGFDGTRYNPTDRPSTTTSMAPRPTPTSSDQLSSCARTCFSKPLDGKSTGCPPLSLKCLCSKPDFFAQLHNCATTSCTNNDVIDLDNYAKYYCSKNSA